MSSENFNKRERSWDLSDDNESYQSIQHGFYWFDYKQTEGGRFDWVECPIDQSRDFSIKTSIAHISGHGANGFGLLWGLADASNLYSFNVSSTNQYQVDKSTDGEWATLTEWTDAPQIDRNNSVYVMTIKKVGDTLQFYTNDILLHERPFEPFFGDMIGINIWEQQKIAVDWIYVYQEPEGDAQ